MSKLRSLTFLLFMVTHKMVTAIMDDQKRNGHDLISSGHCDTIVVSKTLSTGKDTLGEQNYPTNYLTSLAESASGTIRFSSVQQLLRLKDDSRLIWQISSTPCLAAVIETDRNDELSPLIDFVTDLNVKDKRLHVVMSSGLESRDLKHKRINFNVTISHLGSGNIDLFNV